MAWDVLAGTFLAGNNANVSPSAPSHQADDWLFYIMSATDIASNVGNFSAPDGTWTQVTNTLGTGNRLAIYRKKAASGAETIPATTYAGGGTGDCVIGGIVRVRGGDATTIMDVVGTHSTSAAVATNIGAIAGISPTVNDGIVIVVGERSDDTTGGADVLTGDSLTWNEAVDFKSSLGNDGMVVVDFATWTGAAPTITNKTFTITGTTNTRHWTGIMFSLKPASADITKTLTPATETDAAQTLTKTQQALSVSITPVGETNAAQSLGSTIGPAIEKTLAVATETDTAQTLTFTISGGDIEVSITPATEADAAQALAFTQQSISVTITPATEAEAAQGLAFSQAAISITITPAAELDQAVALSIQGAIEAALRMRTLTGMGT